MKPPKRLPKIDPFLEKAQKNLRKEKSRELEKRSLIRKSRLPTEKDFINVYEEEKLRKEQTEYIQDKLVEKG